MKKIAFSVLSILLTTNAYCAIISYDNVVSANDVNCGWLNGQKNTIYTEFNGSIDSDNIKNDSLTEADFADSANPVVRDYEFLGNFTYTGHLPATSANLTSDISAGTSYVNGYRNVTSATSTTYTASKDTWVYIDQNGVFQYVEVAVGAAQPTTPTNSLLLAQVTTSGAAITTVTDKRQLTPPNLRIYQNYVQGCVISYDTADTIKINAGEVELGAGAGVGKRRNTTATSLVWTDLDTGTEANGLYFVWAYPDSSNTTAFLGKISVSSTDVTGVTNERLLGYFYNDESLNISADCVGNYKGDGSSAPNINMVTGTSTVTTTSTSPVQIPDMALKFYACGTRPITMNFTAPFYKADGQINLTISMDGVEIAKGRTYHHDGSTGSELTIIPITLQYTGKVGQGLHNVNAKWWVDTGSGGQYGTADGPRRITLKEE